MFGGGIELTTFSANLIGSVLKLLSTKAWDLCLRYLGETSMNMSAFADEEMDERVLALLRGERPAKADVSLVSSASAEETPPLLSSTRLPDEDQTSFSAPTSPAPPLPRSSREQTNFSVPTSPTLPLPRSSREQTNFSVPTSPTPPLPQSSREQKDSSAPTSSLPQSSPRLVPEELRQRVRQHRRLSVVCALCGLAVTPSNRSDHVARAHINVCSFLSRAALSGSGSDLGPGLGGACTKSKGSPL